MNHKRRTIIHAAAALGLILLCLAGFLLLKSSRQSLARHQPAVSHPLVRAVPVRIEPVTMSIAGQGTVQPRRESRLVAQVSGRVEHLSDNLVNGGRVRRGELLLTIEPRDYEIAVTLAEASIKDAESRYEQARQEARAARREWAQVHPEDDPPPLVAKEPQLAAAQAALDAERANLDKARLNLARTRITAPFDGRISAKQVDLGQYVTPGQSVAAVYETAAVEIVVPLADGDLRWLDVPGFTTDAGQGAAATVHAGVAGRKMTWSGRVVRAEGKIDPQTRLVNIVVRVPEPDATRPPLAVGQFVEVALAGQTLEDAAVIPRAALHDENTVWQVDPAEERLYFRTIEVARRDRRGVVVSGGLHPGQPVVVSPLKTATDGMKVRLPTAASDEAADDGEKQDPDMVPDNPAEGERT
ncbi:MAG: efflux RND transporter periplasmic adaptor subunit [Desulfosudaceae bacterium]